MWCVLRACVYVYVLTFEFKLFLFVVCACVYVSVLTFEFELLLYVAQVGVQVFDADVYYGRNSFDHVRNIIGREPLVQQVLYPLLNTNII